MQKKPISLNFDIPQQESHRHVRVASSIRDELTRILQKETIITTEALTTISTIEVSSDYQWADVFVSVFPNVHGDSVLEELTNSVYQLQKMLNRAIHMKHTPKLRFHIDKTYQNKLEASSVIEALLQDEQNTKEKESS